MSECQAVLPPLAPRQISATLPVLDMSAYAELIEKLQRAHVLGTVDSLLGWDEQVNLPPGSAGLRAEQMALMAELGHAAA
ncbi:MAG: hypothetical protein ABSE59_00490, partial [Opitutaceae bacterium]